MDGPEELEVAREAKARYLRGLSREESVAQYLAMMAEFGPMLEETEAVFRPEKIRFLKTLQERIASLNRGTPR